MSGQAGMPETRRRGKRTPDVGGGGDDKMGASSYKRPWIAAKALQTAVSAPLWPYGLGRLLLATCECKMWAAQLESDGQVHQDP